MSLSEQRAAAGDSYVSKDSAPGETWQRRHPRSAVLWAAQLAIADGRVLDCAVLDLSAGGAKLMVKHNLSTGDKVRLTSRRFGDRQARVAWTEPERVGLQFVEIDESAVSKKTAGNGTTMSSSVRQIKFVE